VGGGVRWRRENGMGERGQPNSKAGAGSGEG
jgi:hypothetical protein